MINFIKLEREATWSPLKVRSYREHAVWDNLRPWIKVRIERSNLNCFVGLFMQTSGSLMRAWAIQILNLISQ